MQITKHLQAFSVKFVALFLALIMVQPLGLRAQSSSPQLPDPGKVSMNAEQQQKLGLQGMGEVYKQMPVLPDSDPLSRYIEHLGKKLTEVLPPDHTWPYQFHVIPASDINAFALPGGPIFVNVATIQSADSEAELAGVMSHEISHVYMQHSAKQAPKAAVTQIFAGLAGVLLPESGLGNLGRVGIQIAGGSVLSKYSRKDESQADAVGAIIMYKAGYNPQAMADFFTKLEQKYGKGGPQFLSDHPNPGNRQQAIKTEIRPWPRKDYIGSSNTFERAHREAEGLKTYTAKEISEGAKSGAWQANNQRSGAWPSGVPIPANGEVSTPQTGSQPATQPTSQTTSQTSGQAGAAAAPSSGVSYELIKPSGKFAQMSLTSLTISYPDNWKAAGNGDNATIGPTEGVTQNGVSYGVVMSSAPSGTLDAATQALIQNLQNDNAGMHVTENSKPITVNGVEARSTYLSSYSPLQVNGQPLPERDWLVTMLNRSGALSFMVFVAPEHDFNKLRPTFEQMLKSVQMK